MFCIRVNCDNAGELETISMSLVASSAVLNQHLPRDDASKCFIYSSVLQLISVYLHLQACLDFSSQMDR